MKIKQLSDLKLSSLKLGGVNLNGLMNKIYWCCFSVEKNLSGDFYFNCQKFLGASFAILQKCKYLFEKILHASKF